MKPLSLKEKVINYRKRGYSYNMISQKSGLSKSTLSDWLRAVPYRPNKEVIKRIGLARVKSANFKHKQKMVDIITMKQLAQKDIGRLTKRDLWLLGIGIYLGEGSKIHEQVRVINSDPKIIKITMRWFREICGLCDENFSPVVHTYPDNNIRETIKYWSKIISIPEKQFITTQIDRRTNKSVKNKRKLPYGTLHLRTKSCEKKECGRSLHRRIIGWTEAVSR